MWCKWIAIAALLPVLSRQQEPTTNLALGDGETSPSYCPHRHRPRRVFMRGSPGRYFLSIKPGCVRKSKLFNGGEQFLNGIAVSMIIVGDLKICVENVPGGSYRRVTEFMAPISYCRVFSAHCLAASLAGVVSNPPEPH